MKTTPKSEALKGDKLLVNRDGTIPEHNKKLAERANKTARKHNLKHLGREYY